MKMDFFKEVKPEMPHMTNKFKTIIYKFRVRGKKLLTFSFLCLLFALFSLPGTCSFSDAAEIIGPEVSFKDKEIFVKASLLLDEKYIEELKNGIEKQYKFYIDIFRVWNTWPDEFILGKLITKTLKSDPVKAEYIATSGDGNILIRKRFKSFESMTKWALAIDNLRLADTKELAPGIYYVRVTVESKIRKLPPVIGYFMIFLPENEFRIKKDSPTFTIEGGQKSK